MKKETDWSEICMGIFLTVMFVLMIICMCGCTPVPEDPNNTITLTKAPKVEYFEQITISPLWLENIFRDKISEKALLYRTTKFIINDRDYAQPTSKWVKNVYIPWYRDTMNAIGMMEYTNSSDCDKHATLFKIMAQICHKRTGTSKAQSLTIAEIHYITSGTSEHAINCIMCSDDVIFIEPQTGMEVYLSQKQKDSIKDFIL